MKPISEIRRDNLLLAIDRCKTITALADAAGVSAANLSQVKNRTPESKTGKPKGMGDSLARKIEKALGEPEGWMDVEHADNSADAYHNSSQSDTPNRGDAKRLTSVRKDVRGGSLFPTEDLPQPTEEEFALVPQLDIAAACGNGRFEDHVVVKGGLAFKKSFLREYGVPEHAARIIYASGGSMFPRIQDGRVVLINTAERKPVDGKIFAVCLPDGGLILKRLVHDYHPAAGEIVWILRSDNPDKTAFPDKILPPDDRTMIIGRAVWTDSIL
jgi:phage repressor protein C with HTH and peptisase S24 domain